MPVEYLVANIVVNNLPNHICLRNIEIICNTNDIKYYTYHKNNI